MPSLRIPFTTHRTSSISPDTKRPLKQDTKFTSLKSASMISATTIPALVDILPTLLPYIQNPTPLLRSCKTLTTTSRSANVRARWLVNMYGHLGNVEYIICVAIKRRMMCEGLIESIVEMMNGRTNDTMELVPSYIEKTIGMHARETDIPLLLTSSSLTTCNWVEVVKIAIGCGNMAFLYGLFAMNDKKTYGGVMEQLRADSLVVAVMMQYAAINNYRVVEGLDLATSSVSAMVAQLPPSALKAASARTNFAAFLAATGVSASSTEMTLLLRKACLESSKEVVEWLIAEVGVSVDGDVRESAKLGGMGKVLKRAVKAN